MSYVATLLFTGALFLSTAVLGILVGLKDSIVDSDKNTFVTGSVLQAALVVAFIVCWVIYLKNEGKAPSLLYLAGLAIAMAFVGMGWGGMLGYHQGLKDRGDKQYNAALAIIPIAMVVMALFIQWITTQSKPASHHNAVIGTSFLVGGLFIVAGGIFINRETKGAFEVTADLKFYKAYAGILVGAGALLILLSFWGGYQKVQGGTTKTSSPGIEMT